jgi:hypothetical protein
MTLGQIAQIGEILGGIGILGSLIFVGLQVRQNTETIRASTLQLNTDYWSTFLTNVAHPQFVKIYGKGLTGDDLDQTEFSQFFLLMRAYLLGLENQHYQAFAFPGLRAMWKIVRHTYSDEFVTFVDKQIAATPAHQDSVFRKWKALVDADRSARKSHS